MELEQIVQWTITALPSVTAVLFTFIGVFKLIRDFKRLKFDVKDANAMKDLRAQIRQVIVENRMLKKTLRETLSKMDHVYRPPEEDENVGENKKV